jgi:RNA polymerase sigma-70 factor (ECF subfamily)
VDELTALLLRAGEGDSEAFGRLVGATYPSIWRLCSYLVGTDDADDATQETFLAAWRSSATFRGDSSARTWLFVIARRCAERVASKQPRCLALPDEASFPVTSVNPEAAVVAGDLLARLAPDRRAALVLTQVFGLTYEEAATVCACAVGTIRSRVARARQELLDQDAAMPRRRLRSQSGS